MSYKCRIDINKYSDGMLYAPAKITCSPIVFDVSLALLDTGATFSIMSYAMWIDMGLQNLCWQNNKHQFNLMGTKTINDIAFEELPLVADRVRIGDDTFSKMYYFRIDKLELGIPSIEYPHKIELKNITVGLINSSKSKFIIGMNVLKYLKPNYSPAVPRIDTGKAPQSKYPNYYELELTQGGIHLLVYDRQAKTNNHMQNTFHFLQQREQL